MKLEGKVVVAQGGGPTAVINQSLVGSCFRITEVFPDNQGLWGGSWG